MLFSLLSDALFLENSEEVFGFEESHGELLLLGLNILLENDFFKELLSCDVFCH